MATKKKPAAEPPPAPVFQVRAGAQHHRLGKNLVISFPYFCDDKGERHNFAEPFRLTFEAPRPTYLERLPDRVRSSPHLVITEVTREHMAILGGSITEIPEGI